MAQIGPPRPPLSIDPVPSKPPRARVKLGLSVGGAVGRSRSMPSGAADGKPARKGPKTPLTVADTALGLPAWEKKRAGRGAGATVDLVGGAR